MTHDEKVAHHIAEMAKVGVDSWTAYPPVLRLLSLIGIRVRPPAFCSFAILAIAMGIPFGVMWGTAMWFMFWSHSPASPWTFVVPSVAAGIAFGLMVAGYYRRKARRLGLSDWEDYPVNNSIESYTP